MAEPYIGMVIPCAFNYAPRGWSTCGGQEIQVSQNQALFSLLGSIYGGDNRTYFNLPDLRGRTIIGDGQGPGLSLFTEGQKGGTETVTQTMTQMAAHTHTATFTPTGGSAGAPLSVSVDVSLNTTTQKSTPDATNKYLGPVKSAGSTTPPNMWSLAPSPATSKVSLGGVNVSGGGGGITGGTVTNAVAGGSQQMPIRNPYLVLKFCIALEGLFPPRD